MKEKRTAPGKDLKGAGGLLNIAVRLQGDIDTAAAPYGLRVKVGLGLVLAGKAIVAPEHDRGLLRAAQIMRATGIANDDLAFYLIHCTAEKLVYEEHVCDDRELIKIDRAILDAERAHGWKGDELSLGRGNWPKGSAPDAIEKLWNVREKRVYEIESSVLQEYSEVEMANLLLADPGAFFARVEKGREELHRLHGASSNCVERRAATREAASAQGPLTTV